MIRRPPRSTRTDTLFPYTTLFRSFLEINVPSLLPNIDPDGLLEYSVVYTDRAINHMSNTFQEVMKDISRTLKQVYNAHCAIVVPGSGTFGMEEFARQFATNQQCLVIRNGWFRYPWSQIFDKAGIPPGPTVSTSCP